MVEEVNSTVGDQMKSFKETLRKDNKLFRAELINVSNKKIDRATGSITEDFMEEQSQSRNNNLIIMGLEETQDEGSNLDLVRSLFKDTLVISKVGINELLRLAKPGDTGPRPVLIKFKTWSDRKKNWFSKSK